MRAITVYVDYIDNQQKPVLFENNMLNPTENGITLSQGTSFRTQILPSSYLYPKRFTHLNAGSKMVPEASTPGPTHFTSSCISTLDLSLNILNEKL